MNNPGFKPGLFFFNSVVIIKPGGFSVSFGKIIIEVQLISNREAIKNLVL
jgi:hypothetical protein